MKSFGLVIGMLLVGALALVAFSRSPAVHEAALEPISLATGGPVTAVQAAEPTPPADAAPVADDASSAAPPADDDAQAAQCEAELRLLGAAFEMLEPISDENGCGARRPLKVSSVGIDLRPAVTTRCEVARALAIWTSDVMIPSAKLHLKATPVAIATGDSYQCRTRRGEGEFKVSEHAMANAIDISGIVFSDGEAVPVMARPDSGDSARAFQAAIRGGACAYFTTVLGPGANAAHADHLHLDLIRRNNGYRICE
ncbi:extensin family protein [Emcibacter sp. SYSU 3D8]|uniref:extensin-like domain-containing protein n=1 Tax=Emcibacter sp. SYSU 3D8 TaxID=3133969 RepID=UPI0031FF074A